VQLSNHPEINVLGPSNREILFASGTRMFATGIASVDEPKESLGAGHEMASWVGLSLFVSEEMGPPLPPAIRQIRAFGCDLRAVAFSRQFSFLDIESQRSSGRALTTQPKEYVEPCDRSSLTP